MQYHCQSQLKIVTKSIFASLVQTILLRSILWFSTNMRSGISSEVWNVAGKLLSQNYFMLKGVLVITSQESQDFGSSQKRRQSQNFKL